MHILRSKQVSEVVREYSGDCLNHDCNARAVMHMSLSHYIRPPQKEYKDIVGHYLLSLTDEERSEILSSVNPDSNH